MMSPTMIIIFAVVTLVGIGFSALYSGLETGIYTLNPLRLTIRSARQEQAALRLRGAVRHPTRTLAVVLIGTNAANYLGTYGIAQLLHGTGLSDRMLIILEVLLVTPILFIFAETLPKDLFRTHTDQWTYWFEPFLTASRWLFTVTGFLPVVQLFTIGVMRLFRIPERRTLSARQRVSHLIREGVGIGILSAEQATLSDRALALRDQRVGHVMIPWRRIVTLSIASSTEARASRFRARKFTRLPVVDTHGIAIGVISWLDVVIDREADTKALMRTPMFVDPHTPIIEALSLMRKERETMAIVTDITGRPVGLVTLKDLVEPLTGELGAW